MKKKLLVLASMLLLVVTMVATLCGCSSFGGIKSAYEDAGYTEEESVPETQKNGLKAILGEDYENICTVHVLTRKPTGLSDVDKTAVVVILEFKSTDALKEELEKNEALKDELKATVEDLQKSDFVNGNCVLVLPIGTDAVSIFKSTK